MASLPGFGISVTKGGAAKNKTIVITHWIKSYMRQSLNYEDSFVENITIMINELQCFDPSCVPIETLVVLVDYSNNNINNKWVGKILKPILEVTIEDVNSIGIPLIWDIWFRFMESEQHFDLEKAIKSCTDKFSNSNELRIISQYLKKKMDEINNKVISLEFNDKKETITTNETTAISTIVKMIPTTTTVVNMKPINQSSNSSSINDIRNVSQLQPVQYMSNNTTADNHGEKIKAPTDLDNQSFAITTKSSKPRHDKDLRQRGCPCCDPDNLDNIVDKMLFLEYPPN
eukprot:gene8025-10874_t